MTVPVVQVTSDNSMNFQPKHRLMNFEESDFKRENDKKISDRDLNAFVAVHRHVPQWNRR